MIFFPLWSTFFTVKNSDNKEIDQSTSLQERNERIRRGFPDVESILDRSEVPLMGPHTPIRDIIDLTSSGSGSGMAERMISTHHFWFAKLMVSS